MQINFTGIKNISAINLKDSKAKYSILSAELANDAYGKDLDEYQNLLKKNPNNLQNQLNPKFVNIKTSSKGDIYFNHKLLEINDSNLSICTYIAKLTKKIAGKKTEEFIVNNDYLTSVEFWSNTFDNPELSIFLINKSQKQHLNILSGMTNPKDCNGISKKINNDISKRMAKYFNVVI